jgi:hypothetical protein
MPNYQIFVSARTTLPDWPAVLAAIRTAVNDATVAGGPDLGRVDSYRLKRQGDWSSADITATQSLIDGAPAVTLQILSQRAIDAWPIEFKALVLALIDQLNTIRAALPSPLPPITPAQALAAIRAKAGTL